MLECVELATGHSPTASVIWLHGLGADGHDFEPLVPELVRPGERALRFVFPHAPTRPVTLNGGFPMRAWYDIVALDRSAPEDVAGIRASTEAVAELIRRENARGIATERVVVAGFSQGGAIALYAGTRYAERLAGLIGLSCYMPVGGRFIAERAAANVATPVFLAHGTHDPVVDPSFGETTRRQLEAAGYPLEWHTYPMPHAVCPEEVGHLGAWLRKVLP